MLAPVKPTPAKSTTAVVVSDRQQLKRKQHVKRSQPLSLQHPLPVLSKVSKGLDPTKTQLLGQTWKLRGIELPVEQQLPTVPEPVIPLWQLPQILHQTQQHERLWHAPHFHQVILHRFMRVHPFIVTLEAWLHCQHLNPAKIRLFLVTEILSYHNNRSKRYQVQ